MGKVGLLLLFAAVIGFEAPRLWKDKLWAELVAFGGLLAVAMVMAFAAALNIELPNPTHVIEAAFGPAAQLIVSFFE